MRNLIDILDLSVKEIDELIGEANNIIKEPSKYADCLKGKIFASLFFEPSTRTRLSFESAMLGLGGSVIGFSDATNSSTIKGESLTDTIQIVSSYSDIIAIRHYSEGSALASALYSSVPIINAGDGGHFHPTQTLADLVTIKNETGRLDDLTIGLCGDLKYGRTVHSLFAAMSRYRNIRFVFISPKELSMPEYVLSNYKTENVSTTVTESLSEALSELDIIYMTRIQKERFSDIGEYERLKNSYILTPELLTNAKKNIKIMHPLPRVNEIAPSVDANPGSVYFKQAFYGRYIRMALIKKLINERNMTNEPRNKYTKIADRKCGNPKCITNNQNTLDTLVRNGDPAPKMICAYCDTPFK